MSRGAKPRGNNGSAVGGTFTLMTGILKRWGKRHTQPHTPFKQQMNGLAGSRARYKKIVTLPDRPFDWKDGAQ